MDDCSTSLPSLGSFEVFGDPQIPRPPFFIHPSYISLIISVHYDSNSVVTLKAIVLQTFAQKASTRDFLTNIIISMDYDVIDPTPFTSDLFFYLDLESPEIQVPDCMSLETPSDLLEITPTSSGETTSSTSNNTKDASRSRSISRGETEEAIGTAPINPQPLVGSDSASDSNSASNGEGVHSGSPHMLEENNEPHEQGKLALTAFLSSLVFQHCFFPCVIHLPVSDLVSSLSWHGFSGKRCIS